MERRCSIFEFNVDLWSVPCAKISLEQVLKFLEDLTKLIFLIVAEMRLIVDYR